ncbi:MAG: tetratricopeptide repeat protein [Acidobacteria bacterium]|nr:tetratricopeptide repeat protein [Acidobacteriota bacterium]
MKKTVFIVFCSLAWLSFQSSSTMAAEETDPAVPVAIVCYVQGAVTVQPADPNAAAVPLNLFDWLSAGATVSTGDDGRVIIAMAGDGSRYELGPGARIVLNPEQPEMLGPVRELPPVHYSPRLPSLTDPRRWGQQAGAIRLRGAAEAGQLYPSNGATLLADQPVLLFPLLPGAEKYRVEIEDEWGNNIFSVETRETRLDLSTGILKPGSFYYWRVRTVSQTRTSTWEEAIFATLSDEDVCRHNELRQQATGSDDPVLWLLLAWLDMELGLRREACHWLKEALRLDPGNPSIHDAMRRGQCMDQNR